MKTSRDEGTSAHHGIAPVVFIVLGSLCVIGAVPVLSSWMLRLAIWLFH
jgi:hypothetical protein